MLYIDSIWMHRVGCGLSNARARRRAAALRSGAESSRGQVEVQECHYIVIIYTVAIINFNILFHSAIAIWGV